MNKHRTNTMAFVLGKRQAKFLYTVEGGGGGEQEWGRLKLSPII